MLDENSAVTREALRQRVIATVAQLGVIEAVPRLAEVLLDRSESALTRTFAANALGRIDPDAALPALARATSDEDETVRRQVARALGAARDPAATHQLEQLRADPAPHIAELAAQLLQATGHGDELPAGQEPPRKARPADDLA